MAFLLYVTNFLISIMSHHQQTVTFLFLLVTISYEAYMPHLLSGPVPQGSVLGHIYPTLHHDFGTVELY